MQRLGITTAFTFDKHFREFGIVTVVPPLDFRQLAPHLVTLYGCLDLRGLLISSSGFTDQAIRDLSSIQPQRLVLCQLQGRPAARRGPRPEGAPSHQALHGRDRAEGPGFQSQVIDSRPVRRSRVFGFSKATPSHQIDPQCVPRNEPGAMRNRFPPSHRCFNSAKLPDKSRWDSSPRTLRKRKCSTTEQPCNSGKAPPCAPISAGS